MDDEGERTVVWRRSTAVSSTPPPLRQDQRLTEPVQPGDPVVANVNQPSAGYRYPAAAAAPTPMQRAVWRAQRIIYYVFGVIQAFIAIRFILKLLAANPASAFTQVIYTISWVFAFPFYGVVPNYVVGSSVWEWFSIVAIVVYALISLALAKLIGLLL